MSKPGRDCHVNSLPGADGRDPLLPGNSDGLTKRPEAPRGWGTRHTLTLWAFVGFFNVYAMRVNLSVALVAMVNSTATPSDSTNSTYRVSSSSSSLPSQLLRPMTHTYKMQQQSGAAGLHLRDDGRELIPRSGRDGEGETSDWSFIYNPWGAGLGVAGGGGGGGGSNDTCPDPPGWGNSTQDKPGDFNWDESTQGLVLGAFFYGYLVSQLPGGWIATRFGGKRVYGLGVLCTSVLTLLTPLAAKTSVYLLIALRALEGLGEGVTFSAMHAMFGVWIPLFERSSLVILAYSGCDIGTVISMPISGLLCDSDLAGGWPSVFYIFGSLGVLWTVGWMLMVHETPATHPWISDEERNYIEASIGKAVNPGMPPWGKIFSSLALWGIVAGQFANNWGLYVFLTCLPTYMKQILKFDMKTNASLSAIPYAVSWVVKLSSGFVADHVRKNGYLSTKNTRKLFNSLGCLLPAFMVLVVGYVGCNHVTAVLALTLCVGLSGFATAGYGVNHLDISPKFCGILQGITNTFGTIPGFMSPLLVGALTKDNETRGQWNIVFYVTAIIYVTGSVIYLFLAQGEVLPWGGLASTTTVAVPDSPAVNSPADVAEEEYDDPLIS